jgi:hypothetical protein
MKPPNLRVNAFKLGFRLMAAAASPWSGLNSRAADKGLWQPVHPFGLPTWWPYSPAKANRVSAEQIALMRSVLPLADATPTRNGRPSLDGLIELMVGNRQTYRIWHVFAPGLVGTFQDSEGGAGSHFPVPHYSRG